ncbi:phage tail length tape measure family protein [Mesorhizobium sp. INR15]|uniref:phage tail length tape measure family protein n=1 Tax=Mesorhizobium sp. INR15 TaxID=2654248 RepID=UPI0018965743|nr:phage tail length tape measure family protein [Mesorhizobium sp. INR15]QPC91451.1 hypothetical protein GA829_12990 [Mesorhizobium sp. INR15]
MANERVVEFAVKARDEYSAVLNNLGQQQAKLSAAAQAASKIRVADNEITVATNNYKRLTSEVDRYKTALENGRKSGSLSASEMRELADTISLTRKRSLEAITTLNQHRVALDGLTGVTRSGFGAFNQMATALERDNVELNAMSAASTAAGTAQGILKKKVDATNVSLGRQAVASGSKIGSGVRAPLSNGAKGEAQSVDVFGLKPYQLTNLGYQINDVISGLAMGQRPLQVFSQQAGQFAQIWPNVMVTLARSIPIIAGVGAVLAPFIATALRLKTTADSVAIFSKELAISADGSRYTAENLAAATDQMGKFGIATSKARDLVKQFVRDGVADKDIVPFAKMAQQLSAITGEGVVDAGKRISTAFSGTVDNVRVLDKQLNFLTATQYAQIESMAKSGNSAGALGLAQDILAGKLAMSADKTSSWGEAAKAAGRAWDDLVHIIEDSGVVDVIAKETENAGNTLLNIAGKVESVVKKVRSVSNAVTGNVDTNDLDAVKAKLAEINGQIADQAKLLESGQAVYADTSALEAQRAALADIVQARQDELTAIKDGAAAQKEVADQTEADKKARLDIQAVLDKQGETLLLETKQANLTNRERYIEAELLKAKNSALEEAKRLNQDILGLTADQTKQIRAQAGLSYDATHKNYEADYVAQRNSGSASASQMAEVVKQAAILADKLQLSTKDILTAISFETKGTFNPSIVGGAGGNYQGLIQFGPGARERYGVGKDSSIAAQMEAAGKYLTDAGVKAGDGLLQIYAAINAGNAKNINASDEKNGGTPGTVLDKVSQQMGDHAAKAEGLLAAYQGVADQAKKTQEYEKDFTARTDAAQAELEAKTKVTRQAAINKAVVDETNRATKAGVELTQQQLDLVKQQAGAEFDRAHANDQVNQLVAQRTALFQSLQIAQQAGDQGKVANTIDLISQVEEKLTSAIPAAIAFWQAIGGSGADQEIAKLQAIQEGIGQTLQRIDKQFLPQAQQLNEQLADIGGNAFSAFAQALANGENAGRAFFDALKQGLADFLIEIGKAIVKQAIFNALSGGAGAGGSGGIGGSIAGWITSLFHGGGVIGEGSSMSRMVNPAVFAGAQRFHSGGVLGLGPNEVPIIGLKDEEMLTSDDPRHIKNLGKGGSGGGQAVNLKNVNLFDPADVLEHALSTVAGEKVFFNFLTRNPKKLQAILNGG